MFDPATTDSPSCYIVEFSRQDGSDADTRNVSATDPLTVNFTNLMKGTEYRARVVAFNVRMQGDFTDYVTERTSIDRELLSCTTYCLVLVYITPWACARGKVISFVCLAICGLLSTKEIPNFMVLASFMTSKEIST